MAPKTSNKKTLVGVRGGAFAPLIIPMAILAGETLRPGQQAYLSSDGLHARPPLNNKTTLTADGDFGAGEVITYQLNGGTPVNVSWTTDQAGTAAALAASIAGQDNVASCVVVAGSSDRQFLMLADSDKPCVINSIAAVGGNAPDIDVAVDTTDKKIGVTHRDTKEPDANGELVYTSKDDKASILVDGDSISVLVGGNLVADTFNANNPVRVRLVEGDTSLGEYRGQTMVTDKDPSVSIPADNLEFKDSGTVGSAGSVAEVYVFKK